MHVCRTFFFNDTATTEIYTLSLHDALPICVGDDLAARPRDGGVRRRALGRHAAVDLRPRVRVVVEADPGLVRRDRVGADRKSTRLNSSHANISYAVFCLKKKKIKTKTLLLV